MPRFDIIATHVLNVLSQLDGVSRGSRSELLQVLQSTCRDIQTLFAPPLISQHCPASEKIVDHYTNAHEQLNTLLKLIDDCFFGEHILVDGAFIFISTV